VNFKELYSLVEAYSIAHGKKQLHGYTVKTKNNFHFSFLTIFGQAQHARKTEDSAHIGEQKRMS
jgi:hypothetical protein